MSLIRSPICTVVGHVDHGKSSILDNIRGSNVIDREAGAITQAIGASIIPFDTIKAKAGDLLKALNLTITIPSLLFIDTPGHAAFTNLRKRGGNLADIAIVVIDINEGIKPQTKEAIEILINYKTPFIIALNKIDLIAGFNVQKGPLLKILNNQSANVQEKIDLKLYEIVGKLNELFQLNSERFDRVNDYTKTITMVPISAKEGIGIPELLMMIMGLAQKYFTEKLSIQENDYAKGTILEVKQEKGMGTVLDVIIYDGTIKTNDTIVIGTLDKPITTKVRGLFEPAPLTEIMEKRAKFKPVKQVVAATGVRISAKNIDNAVAGMPLKACDPKDTKKIELELEQELKEVLIETDKDGIVVKADSLGSLEALVNILQSKKIAIGKASVGNITKTDLIDAAASMEKNVLNGVILGFNIKPLEDKKIKIITSNIIYHLLDDYEKYIKELKKKKEREKLNSITPVAKIELLEGYVFRQNNPAVCGIEILQGKIKTGMRLMNREGKYLTEIKSIQKDKDSVTTAEKGEQLAISMPNITIGRQVKESDILFSQITEDEYREYKKFKDYLTGDEKAILKEISDIMRNQNPVWGV